MLFNNYAPSVELATYVKTYQLRHFVVPKQHIISVKPYVARPQETMAFYIRGKENNHILFQEKQLLRPRAALTGLWTARIDRETVEREFLLVQVVFQPCGLYKLTGIPSMELVNNCIDLADLYPSQIRTLCNRFDDTTDYLQIIETVDQFLISLLRKNHPQQFLFENAFRLLQTHHDKQMITRLAGDSCLSLRQFERKALDYIGVPAATYQRIARFAESFRLKTKKPGMPWIDVAIQSGYYDYQHLVRDYKAFALAHPHTIFAADQAAPEKVLKLGDGY